MFINMFSALVQVIFGFICNDYCVIVASCLFLLLVFTANFILHSNVFFLCKVLLDCFQQYMLKYSKNFFPESDLLKWGCILYASASYMPSNTVIVRTYLCFVW